MQFKKKKRFLLFFCGSVELIHLVYINNNTMIIKAELEMYSTCGYNIFGIQLYVRSGGGSYISCT